MLFRSIRTPTRDAAERLGKAIFALARARGAAMTMPNPRFGAAISPLTEAQARSAGLPWPGSLIVSWVFRESPAERTGFSPQDIITEVAGTPVSKGEDLFGRINLAAATGVKEIPIKGLRRSYRLESDRYTEIFVPLAYVLKIEPTAGEKP